MSGWARHHGVFSILCRFHLSIILQQIFPLYGVHCRKTCIRFSTHFYLNLSFNFSAHSSCSSQVRLGQIFPRQVLTFLSPGGSVIDRLSYRGLPQGSCLSSLFFNVYISRLLFRTLTIGICTSHQLLYEAVGTTP